MAFIEAVRCVVILLLLLVNGCDGQILQRTWHQKHNWRAEDYFDDSKVVLLCKAIEANHLKEMQRLIKDGADVKAKGKGNMTPLLWAFPDNKLERFRLLLENGADPNVYTESNFGVPSGFLPGDSVTHMACRTFFPYFDDVFEHGGDPNLPGKAILGRGETPIFTLIRAGGPDVKRRVEILVQKGADINICINKTPTILAATFGGQYDLVMTLIENGADYRAYMADEMQKLIHMLATADRDILRAAGPEQRADYNRLVKWLEDHGESLESARSDRARWAKWIDNHDVHRKREVEERKQREREAAQQK